MNDSTNLAMSRWADWALLSLSGVLLLPILLVALAPCLLVLMVLWPLLAAPMLAARTLASGERPRDLATPRDAFTPAVRLHRTIPQA